MTEKAWMSVDTYTDIQGLGSIKQKIKADPEQAKKEVSKQFESLLLQMLLKSMREGTRAVQEDQDDAEHKALYEDLFDSQLALSMSKSGVGLAELIEKSIDKAQGIQKEDKVSESSAKEGSTESLKVSQKNNAPFSSIEGFVSTLGGLAKDAAKIIGADPKILLAQAALETNWGKNIISKLTGNSSFNLFNIKADKSWNKEAVQASTQEYEKGLASRTESAFRAYESFAESFKDYVHFLQSNPRYQEALKSAKDPEKFVSALQKANFATDPNYAKKIMQIYKALA